MGALLSRKNYDIYYDENHSISSIYYGTLVIHEGVEVIPNGQFKHNERFSVVILPSTLKRIEAHAFEDTHITSIEIPDTVEYIGDSAFYCCKELGRVKMPKHLKVINHRMFTNDPISQLELPAEVEVIGDFAFTENRLTDISFPSSLKIIGKLSFYGRNNPNVKFNGDLEIMGRDAFPINTKLQLPYTTIVIKDFDQSISPYKRFVERQDGNTLIIKNDVTSIYGMAYVINISDAEEVVLPESLICIEDGCFDTLKLKRINFPSKLKYIGYEAFWNSKLLKNIGLPPSVRHVGVGAFHPRHKGISISELCSHCDKANFTLNDYNPVTPTIRYSDLLEEDKQLLESKNLSPSQIDKNKSKIKQVEYGDFKNDVMTYTYDFLLNIIKNPNYDENKSLDIIENLILSGYVCDEYFDEVLTILFNKKLNRTILLFLSYGFNCGNNFALTKSVQTNNIDIASCLLLMGANPNKLLYKDGDSPLMDAVKSESVELIELLLNSGADVYYKNKDGKCALDYAIESSNQVLINLLSNSYDKEQNEVKSDLNKLELMLRGKKWKA